MLEFANVISLALQKKKEIPFNLIVRTKSSNTGRWSLIFLMILFHNRRRIDKTKDFNFQDEKRIENKNIIFFVDVLNQSNIV